MNPKTFQSVAFGVPIAPSSLIVFVVWEYDGRRAASRTDADQNSSQAAIPKNPTYRRFIS
jgi:hypothetical protein